MSNEQYLISSYFSVGFASIVLGTIAYIILKDSLNQTLANLVDSRFARLVQKFFLYGLIFPAFAGFTSVSYKTCKLDTYEKIVADRTHLVGVSLEQGEFIMQFLLVSLLIWAVIVAFLLLINERLNRS